MLWWLLLITLLVFVVVAIAITSSSSPRQSLALTFPLVTFHQECGSVPLRVEYFRDARGAPSLMPTEQREITVSDWITTPEQWTGWASKLKFRRNSDHPVARFMLRWLQQVPLPPALQERLQVESDVEFCLRFTNGEWHYPNHFDCVDNYAFVLAGERKVKFDRQPEIHTLSPGSVRLIPVGQEHEFWSEGPPSQFNLLFNVDFNLAPTERLRCRKAFDRLYPEQAARVRELVEYT